MINAIILKKDFINDDVFLLNIKCNTKFNFKAGQFVTIHINDTIKKPCFRAYSISSEPNEENEFELCIKKIQNGRGSTWLSNLKENDEIEFLGPTGDLTFKTTPHSSVFIATGTGIAPFKSIITDELKKGNKEQIHLIFGLRHTKDVFYKIFFEKLEQQYSNFKFTITLSKPNDGEWNSQIGRVTKHLEEFDLPKNGNYYICGLNAMIENVVEVLKIKKINQKNIYFEKFD